MSYENFDPNDLLIQSYSTKPSGFVHRIPHGIRAIHLPTGTVVTCDADRSQHKNRHDALTQLWDQVQGKPTYQELAAQVEALQSTAAKVVTGDAEIAELEPLLDATPQQHLAEIRAEAGRAGFVAGARQATENEIGWFGNDIQKCANQYADSIRKGGE